MIAPSVKVGDTFPNNKWGMFTVIEYISAKKIKIKFFITNSIKYTSAQAINKGNIRDTQFPSIYGIGYVGTGKFSKAKYKNIYSIWVMMLARCYDTKTQITQKTYINCTVCSNWFNFQNYATWYTENVIKNWEVDKDLLLKGNKIYSPDTCIFVPRKINLIFHNKKQNYLPGVEKLPYGKYRSSIGIEGKKTQLGIYESEKEAHLAYCQYKAIQIENIILNEKNLPTKLIPILKSRIAELKLGIYFIN